MTTFTALKIEAQNASSPITLYRVVRTANEKIARNIGKAQFLSFKPGAAAEAAHYFQNVLPVWQAIVSEINAIWTVAVAGKSAEEIVEIMGAGA